MKQKENNKKGQIDFVSFPQQFYLLKLFLEEEHSSINVYHYVCWLPYEH